jgi:hypothetical protein
MGLTHVVVGTTLVTESGHGSTPVVIGRITEVVGMKVVTGTIGLITLVVMIGLIIPTLLIAVIPGLWMIIIEKIL